MRAPTEPLIWPGRPCRSRPRSPSRKPLGTNKQPGCFVPQPQGLTLCPQLAKPTTTPNLSLMISSPSRRKDYLLFVRSLRNWSVPASAWLYAIFVSSTNLEAVACSSLRGPLKRACVEYDIFRACFAIANAFLPSYCQLEECKLPVDGIDVSTTNVKASDTTREIKTVTAWSTLSGRRSKTHCSRNPAHQRGRGGPRFSCMRFHCHVTCDGTRSSRLLL